MSGHAGSSQKLLIAEAGERAFLFGRPAPCSIVATAESKQGTYPTSEPGTAASGVAGFVVLLANLGRRLFQCSSSSPVTVGCCYQAIAVRRILMSAAACGE